jgi:hypothetical protein
MDRKFRKRQILAFAKPDRELCLKYDPAAFERHKWYFVFSSSPEFLRPPRFATAGQTFDLYQSAWSIPSAY